MSNDTHDPAPRITTLRYTSYELGVLSGLVSLAVCVMAKDTDRIKEFYALLNDDEVEQVTGHIIEGLRIAVHQAFDDLQSQSDA